MIPKFVEVDLDVRGVDLSFDKQYIALINNRCCTGKFEMRPGHIENDFGRGGVQMLKFFVCDNGMKYRILEIERLWEIKNTPSILEIIKSSNPISCGKINLIPKSEPSGFYYIKYDEGRCPYRLLLYFVMSNSLLERLIGSKIKYYGICDDWGKPFNSDYRYDVVDYTVIKDDVKDTLSYLERRVAKRRNEINNYLLSHPTPRPSYLSAQYSVILYKHTQSIS
jgi:hypothetical protein